MTEDKKQSPRPYQARVEYRAVQPEVEQKIAAGYSKILIYEELVAAGWLTISYSAFCDYVRGGGSRKHGRPKKVNWRQKTTATSSPTKIDKSTPFFIDRSKTLEDLA
ncbi:TraK family protein [Deltaproteobacteria bacterium OttesenSCG-928-K17]|nr:TraK family protein [Deltaproteobacteria bacterium OttesenSCG-928-K17]